MWFQNCVPWKNNNIQFWNDVIALNCNWKNKGAAMGIKSWKNNKFLIHYLCMIFYQFSFELCLLPTSITLVKFPLAKTLCGPTIWGKLKLFSRSNQLVTGLQHCTVDLHNASPELWISNDAWAVLKREFPSWIETLYTPLWLFSLYLLNCVKYLCWITIL